MAQALPPTTSSQDSFPSMNDPWAPSQSFRSMTKSKRSLRGSIGSLFTSLVCYLCLFLFLSSCSISYAVNQFRVFLGSFWHPTFTKAQYDIFQFVSSSVLARHLYVSLHVNIDPLDTTNAKSGQQSKENRLWIDSSHLQKCS